MPTVEGKETHHSPAVVVGSPADLGTAAEEGSPAAGEGLAGTPPAAGHTGHYLQGATTGAVSNPLTSLVQQESRHLKSKFQKHYLRRFISTVCWMAS